MSKPLSYLLTSLSHPVLFNRVLSLIANKRIVIVMYHGINKHLKITPDDFEKHLQWYSEHFESAWMSEIPSFINCYKNLKFQKPKLILTFDDGLKNNADYAAPLLEKYSIKATFYIPSGLLSGTDMLWNHEILCRLMLASPTELAQIGLEFPQNKKEKYVVDYVNNIKGLAYTDRHKLISDIKGACKNQAYDDWMKQRYLVMSKEDVKQLPDIIEIGSHSISHELLHDAPKSVIETEVNDSLRPLQQLSPQTKRTFCYPNGLYREYTLAVVAKKYQCAIVTTQGIAKYKQLDCFKMPRISAEVSVEGLRKSIMKHIIFN